MAQNPAPKTASTLSVSTAIALGGASLPTAGAKFAAATPAVVTSVLYSPDGAALYFNGSPLATGSSISGTTGKLAKFTAATTLGDSIITESGTTVTVANTLNATTLGGTLSTAAQPNITSVGTLTGGATGAGFTIALTTSTVTGTIPSANVSGSYTGITGVGTLTAGATGAGFTIALSTSTVTGTLSTTRGGTAQDTSGSTGVAQVAAGTWSVTTTLQNAVQDNITRVGAVASGSLASGFTTVTVPLGGTGATTFTAGRVLLGNGTSAITTNAGLVYSLSNDTAFAVSGTKSAGGSARQVGLGNTLSVAGSANEDIAGFYNAVTLVEAGSGTHTRLIGAGFASPSVTAGGATATDAFTVWISGAPSAVVSGANYALGVESGNSMFGGSVTATAFIPSSSSVPTNGMYLSAANTVAFSTNSTLAVSINSGNVSAVGYVAGTGTTSLSAFGTGNNNNIDIGNNTVITMTGDGSGTSALTGITGGVAGRMVMLINGGADTITISALSGGSSAGNQFINSVSPSWAAGVGLFVMYTGSKWRIMSQQTA